MISAYHLSIVMLHTGSIGLCRGHYDNHIRSCNLDKDISAIAAVTKTTAALQAVCKRNLHSIACTCSMAATTAFANGAGGQMMQGNRPVSAKRPASAPVMAPAAKRQATKQEDKPNTDEELDVLRASHSTILQ